MSAIKDSELTEAYSLLSSSALGRIILEDLTSRFDGLSFVPGGLEGQRMTEHNEGRRFVVHYIRGRIEQGSTRKPSPHKEK